MTAPTTLPTNHGASAASNGPAYKRVSLIKDRVGQTRAASFPLPPHDHVYGMKMAKDPWSAGTVLSHWVLPVHSAEAVAQRSWVRTNGLALKHGCITAKSQREFSKQHPNIKVPKPASAIREKFHPPSDRIYGMPSCKSDDDLRLILEGRYNPHLQEGDDRDYPLIANSASHGRLPKPKPTRSSELLCKARMGKPQDASAKLFVMKKFLHVPARISSK